MWATRSRGRARCTSSSACARSASGRSPSPTTPPPRSGSRLSDDVSDQQDRARKVFPQYGEGPLVKVGWARNQAEAELIANLLLEEGIPSLAKRSGGFDVPDFLASGPRDVLVAAGGLDAAREILGEPRGSRRLPAGRHPPWMRVLAFTLAFTVLIAFVASVAVPFFD